MAGWGDDPTLEQVRVLVYDEGWKVTVIDESASSDTVTVEKDGETRSFTSDHIAFHRFVEGLREDFDL